MKRISTIVLLLLFALSGYAEKASLRILNPKLPIADSLEEAARKVLFKQLGMVRYPKSARQDHVTGKVVVQFNINPNNTVTNFRFERGLTDDINAEVVKIFAGLTLPAGLPHDVNFIASFIFSLQDPDNPLAVPRSKVDYDRRINTGYVANNFKTLALNELVTYGYIHSANPDVARQNKAILDTFYKHLQYSVTYPLVAVKNNIEGYVNAQFNVGDDRKITNVVITRGLSEEINKEIIKALTGREVPPLFQPNVNYTAPFHLYISHSDGSKPKPINYIPGKLTPPLPTGYPDVRLNSTTVSTILASGDDN